jgi:hypothetical protein
MGFQMERKIDKVLSRIIPGGLPKYPGLPERWFLYPYGISVLFFASVFSIYFITNRAIIEYYQNPVGIPIISGTFLVVHFAVFLFLLRANIHYWLTSLPTPKTFADFISFAKVVRTKGNHEQQILLKEYMANTYPNQDLSKLEFE